MQNHEGAGHPLTVGVEKESENSILIVSSGNACKV